MSDFAQLSLVFGIVAPLAILSSVSAAARTAIHAATGLDLKAGLLAGFAMGAPFAWAGIRIGSRIHTRLTPEQLRRAIGVLRVVPATTLLARTLPS